MLGTQPPPPPPPAALPPPNRRVGRRITRVPGIIFTIIGCIIAVSVAYTLYQASERQARQRELSKTAAAAADPSSILKDAPSGYIAPAKYGRADPSPRVERDPLPVSTKKEEPKPEAVDDNGREKGRVAAWNLYWEEYNKLRKDHFDQRRDAIMDMKTSVESGAHRGEAAPAATPVASTTPATSSPYPASSGSVANLWGGGGFGGNGFGGYGGGWPGIQAAHIDREGQEQKIGFAGQQGDLGKNDVVPTVRKPPDPYALMAGSFVKFTTINESNSDVPGSQIGMVTESVYNTSDGSCILVPAGSKLIGHYNSMVSAGQDRLPGVLTRIIFPDGSSQAIGAMESADNAGSAGQHDQVNRHLIQKFGAAALSGLFGAGIYLAVPHNNNNFNNGIDATQLIGASLAQQIGQVGQQITQQALSVPNTITIRAGYNGTMVTDKDIKISPPWSCNGERNHSISPIMTVGQ